jgi:hypothetical protein
MLTLATMMTDAGTVSVPRQQLADMLGVDPRRITDRIGEARQAGLLDLLGGGYRGRSAEYIAVIGTGSASTITRRKVPPERPPLSGKVAGKRPPLFRYLSPGESDTKVDAEPVPNARAYLSGTVTACALCGADEQLNDHHLCKSCTEDERQVSA